MLILYYIAPKKLKNTVLLIFSLAFYWWGEPKYTVLMLVTITFCYLAGLLTEKLRETRFAKPLLVISVAVPLIFLGIFKYADFILGSIGSLTGADIPLFCYEGDGTLSLKVLLENLESAPEGFIAAIQ